MEESFQLLKSNLSTTRALPANARQLHLLRALLFQAARSAGGVRRAIRWIRWTAITARSWTVQPMQRERWGKVFRLMEWMIGFSLGIPRILNSQTLLPLNRGS